MNTPIQLFFISLGIIIALKSVINGACVGTLPAAWFCAEGSEYDGYIWLGGCLVFGYLLIIQYKVYGRGNNNKIPQ